MSTPAPFYPHRPHLEPGQPASRKLDTAFIPTAADVIGGTKDVSNPEFPAPAKGASIVRTPHSPDEQMAHASRYTGDANALPGTPHRNEKAA